jgi:hypothetical protein
VMHLQKQLSLDAKLPLHARHLTRHAWRYLGIFSSITDDDMATDFDARLAYRQHYKLGPFWRLEMIVQFNRRIKHGAVAMTTQNNPLWLNSLGVKVQPHLRLTFERGVAM